MPSIPRFSWPGLALLLGLAAATAWLTTRPADRTVPGPGQPGETAPGVAATAGQPPPRPPTSPADQRTPDGAARARVMPDQALAGWLDPPVSPSASPPAGAAAQVPSVLTPDFFQASLAALRQHGVDLRRPLRNQHVLQVTESTQLQPLQALLRTAGFGQARVSERLDHGSQPVWVVEVERLSPADPQRLLSEGLQLRALAATVPGAQYATWQPLPP